MTLVSANRDDLSSLENTLLWAMRVWAIGLGRRIPVEEPVVRAFAKLGAADAGGQMQGFVMILGQSAVRMIDLDCVCRRRLSGDERRLLGVLALVQHGKTAEALILLRPLIRTGATMSAIDSAQRLMASLSAARLFLTPPDSAFGLEADLGNGLPASSAVRIAAPVITLH